MKTLWKISLQIIVVFLLYIISIVFNSPRNKLCNQPELGSCCQPLNHWLAEVSIWSEYFSHCLNIYRETKQAEDAAYYGIFSFVLLCD